jgi:hypothetical protein
LIDDPDFQRLSVSAKLVFHTLRLSREHRASGIFRYYLQTIATRTGMKTNKVSDALSELATPKPGEALGWIAYDDAILWIVNGLRYDPHISLANEHHITTVKNELSELPRRKIVLSYCDYYKLPYPFAWVEPTHSQQDSDSDSETKESKDSETKESKDSDSLCLAVRGTPPMTPKDLQALYNQKAPEYLPRAETLNDQRKKAARKYLGLYPDRAWWDVVFDQYEHSRFLAGLNRGNGHGSFLPDFDFLLRVGKDKIDNCVKVHDGKYRDSTTPLSPMSEKTQGNLAVVQHFAEGGIHDRR